MAYLVLIEEHLQLPHGDTEVGLVELIGNVPAEGAKLPPFLNQSMEETQPKQQLLPLFLWGQRGRGKEGERGGKMRT